MQLSLKTPAQYRIRAQVKTYASRRILSWLELGSRPKRTQIAGALVYVGGRGHGLPRTGHSKRTARDLQELGQSSEYETNRSVPTNRLPISSPDRNVIRRLIGEAEVVFEVSQAQRNALAEDGIVRLEGLIDRELLAKLQSCWEWSVRHPGPIASGKPEGDEIFFVDNGNPDARSMYESLVSQSPFPRIAADLWHSSFVGFYAEEIFWKTGSAGLTHWHQDTVYAPWGGEHWCNFWIPLVAMSGEQSIRVVHGSHRGIMYDGYSFNSPDPTDPLWGEAGNFPRLPDISADLRRDPDSWDTRSFDVVPGDVVVLHPHCLHSGGGVDPETLPERKNIVLRFFGDKSYYSEHLPSMQGMYDHKPIPGANGEFLRAGDQFRPAGVTNLVA